MRSTSAEVLDSSSFDVGAPDEDFKGQEGVLSVVTDESPGEGFGRRLPSLYLDKALLFASRHVEEVGQKLQETIDTLRASEKHPTYLAQACKRGDTTGIYASELNVRAANRKRLERAGLNFAVDPFVRYFGKHGFSCDDFGTFSLGFVIVAGPPGTVISPANAVFSLAARRLWKISVPELTELTLVLTETPIVGGSNEDAGEARLVTDSLGQFA